MTDKASRLHFLAHLARLGAVDIHPRGAVASHALETALDLHSGQRILEIGCGTGQTLVRITSRNAVTAYGVDVLDEMLVVARRRIRVAGVQRHVSLVRCDAIAGLPFSDGSFDRAYAESVIGFQSGSAARSLLAELHRVLRGGGRVVLNDAVWRPGTDGATVARIHDSSLLDFGLAQASSEGWAVEDWLMRMRESGFSARAVGIGREPPRTAPGRRVRAMQQLGRARALTMSTALTMLYRLRGRVAPILRSEARRYRDLLRSHAADGRHIEPFLFILDKPTSPTS